MCLGFWRGLGAMTNSNDPFGTPGRCDVLRMEVYDGKHNCDTCNTDAPEWFFGIEHPDGETEVLLACDGCRGIIPSLPSGVA